MVNGVAFVALAVAASTAGVAAQEVMCNPSNCPSTTQECTPCNPRTDGSCVPPFPASGESGVCTEPVHWDYTGITYGVPLYKRCRQIVDPGWTEVNPEPQNFGSYVRACREGFVTCNDGSCEYMGDQTGTDGLEHDIPEDCFFGINDVSLTVAPDAKCNVRNDDVFLKINGIQDKLDYSKYCTSVQAGGVRYGPFRCYRSFVSSPSACPEGAKEIQAQCEVKDSSLFAELGISDGCHADCDADRDTKDIPGCCLIPEGGSICSHIEILDPTDSVDRCTSSELVDDKCNICENGDSSVNTHPYCCKDVPAGQDPVCVNSQGDVKGSASKACNNGNSLRLDDDVCYVDSDGSDANPPAISDTDVPAVGVDITFKFDGRTPTNLESPCCCDVVCTCFGDPHCVSFLGRYEISQQSEGEYTMVDDPTPKLKVEATLGRPLGVNKKIKVTIDTDEYLFNAFDCIFDRNFELNGVDTPMSDLPSLFNYQRDPSRPTASERAAARIGRINSLNAFMVNNPPFIDFEVGIYKVQLKCVRFRMTQGYFANSWWSRIDTKITRKTTQADVSGCCPPIEDVFQQITSDDATGYCYSSPYDQQDTLPSTMDVTESRRLKAVSPDAVQRVQRALKEGKRERLEDRDLEKLVSKYAHLQKISLVEGEVALHEQGRRALEDVVQIASDSCFSFASDPVFDLANKGECSQGMTLEVAKVGTENWIPIKFFPRDVEYCDDSIKVIFKHTLVSAGVYLDNTYKLRLQHCTPDLNKCPQFDVCEAEPGVSDIGVLSYMYGSAYTDYFEKLVEYASAHCPCAGGDVSVCMSNCIGYGDCPDACAP